MPSCHAELHATDQTLQTKQITLSLWPMHRLFLMLLIFVLVCAVVGAPPRIVDSRWCVAWHKGWPTMVRGMAPWGGRLWMGQG